MNWKKDQGASVLRKGPDEESIDASILTIRFFIQDNEKCSIRNISKIYDKLEDKIALKKYFIGSRDNLNNFLASATFFNIGGKKIIRREVLDVFIYGGLSHANLQKKKIYDNWMNNPLIKDFLTNEFVYTVSNLIHFILHFKKQNDKLLKMAKKFVASNSLKRTQE